MKSKLGISDEGFNRIANHVLGQSRTGKLDAFTKSYIDTALWAETGSLEEEDNPESFDSQGFGVEDFDEETLRTMIEDCNDFQEDNYELLKEAYSATGQNEEIAGHDFWLTRNGHGAGFWDGDWKTEDVDYRKSLTTAAKQHDEVSLYLYKDDSGETKIGGGGRR